MRVFFYFLCIVFIHQGVLTADWNQNLDEESFVLWKNLENLQMQEYENNYEFFTNLRKNLLKDFSLKKQIAETSSRQRIVFLKPKDQIVIKKRASNRIHEFFAWELACLLGLGDYVVPSFPMEISGKKVIVQRMEPFTFAQARTQLPLPSMMRKVSLETYWKAHLAAYLIGLGDMVGKNIGISPAGMIRFFDLEYSLSYLNSPIRTDRTFKTGFAPQSLEWSQYSQPLDRKTAQDLQKLVASFLNAEKKMETYQISRTLPFIFNEDGFRERLEKIRAFSFKEGQSFRDFYASLYPRLSEGLDSLVRIAENVFGEKVGHGSALMLICRKVEMDSLSKTDKKQIEKWISTYVD